ncbi:MAG TPA: hypothetical protein VM347_11785 [Nonomuraea sp.]|nr:hypothetical protein [Nonomuraea sp.]
MSEGTPELLSSWVARSPGGVEVGEVGADLGDGYPGTARSTWTTRALPTTSCPLRSNTSATLTSPEATSANSVRRAVRASAAFANAFARCSTAITGRAIRHPLL